MSEPLTPEEIEEEDERGVRSVSAVPLERYLRLRATLDEHDGRMQELRAMERMERDALRARVERYDEALRTIAEGRVMDAWPASGRDLSERGRVYEDYARRARVEELELSETRGGSHG